MKISNELSGQEMPLSQKLAVIGKFLESQGAIDLAVMELSGRNFFADALIVAGASSRRHAQGLADGIGRLCRENSYEFFGMEGYENAQWILVDCNDVVINIFQEEARGLYRLEELWSKNARPGAEEN